MVNKLPHMPKPPQVKRITPPAGFRPEDLVTNAMPDTQETIERSFNPQAKLAFEELLRLRRLRPGGK